MHIAFWSPGWPLEKYQNGIVTYIHWMKREHEARGHRVSIFTRELDPAARAPGIHSVGLRWRDRVLRRFTPRHARPRLDTFGFGAVIASAILRVHRRDPIDVIEMEESFGWCAEVARRTSLPVVVKLHGPAFLSLVEEDAATEFGREKIEREGEALRSVRVLMAPSSTTLERTVAHYRLTPAVRAHVVNPMVMDSDTPLWRPEACSPDTILYVGRFDLPKGADILLRAFRSMLQVKPDLRLVFVGPDTGLATPGGKRIHFEEYREQLFGDLRQQVDYRGRLPNREIARLRTAAMVTVVASRWENQPYTLLEAMFQGCPVVSTDAGGCPESVVPGVNGRLARAGDPAALGAEIMAMMADPGAAGAMGTAARRYVLERHAPAGIAAASRALYDQAVTLARPGSNLS